MSDAPHHPFDSLPPFIGRFQVLQALGRGTYGRVFRACDPDLRREVAIKVPNSDALTGTFREDFLKEARAVAAINHPNVCPVYEVGTVSEVPYLVMRYVAGGTLANLLARGPVPPRDAVAIARKLALGLAAAHEMGIVHRDLKPANVLYDGPKREVLITDFGLAKLSAGASQATAGLPKGTPAYMAPEQWRPNSPWPVGPAADLYALGVILYQMLAGRLPFSGAVYELMLQVWEDAPQPPTAVRPDLDPALDALCLKALEKNPGARYASAEQFRDALSEYLSATRAPQLTETRRTPSPPPYGPQARGAGPGTDAPSAPYGPQARGAGPGTDGGPPNDPRGEDGALDPEFEPLPMRPAAPGLVSTGGPAAPAAAKTLPRSALDTAGDSDTFPPVPHDLPIADEVPPRARSKWPAIVVLCAMVGTAAAGSAWYFAQRGKTDPTTEPEVATAKPRPAPEVAPPAPVPGAPHTVQRPEAPPPRPSSPPSGSQGRNAGPGDGGMTTSPDPKTATPPKPVVPKLLDGSRARALVVAVGAHADPALPPRPKIAADADAWVAVLTDLEVLGIPPKRVQTLVSGTNIPPTRAAVLGAIQTLAAEASPEETVFLVLIGQGATVDGRPAFLCADAPLPAADLEPLGRRLRAGRVFVAADLSAPDAGAFWEQPSAAFGRAFLNPDPTGDPAPGRFLLAAYGVPTSKLLTRDGLGLFTAEAVAGLRGAADAQPDGLVTGEELTAYLARRLVPAAREVRATDEEAIPGLDRARGLGGNFAVARNPRAAAPAEQRLLAWNALAEKEQLPADVAAEGRALLGGPPAAGFERLQQAYRDAADGKLPLAALIAARAQAASTRTVAKGTAERFADDVEAAVQLVCRKHLRPQNPGQLAAGAVRGLFRAADEPVPADLTADADKWDEARRRAALIDARTRVGMNPDLDGPADTEFAIAGLLAALGDPFTTYTPRKAAAEQTVLGQLTGATGVVLRPAPLSNGILIAGVVRDGPAYRAGVKSGDLLIEVQRDLDPLGRALGPTDPRAVLTKDMTIPQLSEYLLGKKGIDVTLVVRRDGQPQPLSFKVTRGEVPLETVVGAVRAADDWWDFMLDAKARIGYIRLTGFGPTTAAELRKLVAALRAEKGELKGLVLDLRDNGGGALKSAVDVAELFLPKGRVVTVRARERPQVVYDSAGVNSFTNFPMVVLANEGTASGAELVAAALQDRERAVVVGVRTFGKGSIQANEPFPRTGGRFLITDAAFVPPNGRAIDRDGKEWGVRPAPGLEVALSPRERVELGERLSAHLLVPRPGARAPGVRDRTDPQIERALEHLRSAGRK